MSKRRQWRSQKIPKKRKQSSDNEMQGDKKMSTNEEQAWNKFIFDNVNDICLREFVNSIINY